jgi:RimJ/RimL family protein N-acetyltransferase
MHGVKPHGVVFARSSVEPTRPDPLPRGRNRIVLRRLTLADLDAFQAYRQDPRIGLYQAWEPQSDAEASRFITEMADVPLFSPGRWVQLGIADRRTDALIGDLGICVAATIETAEIGFTLSRAAQRVGYGTEAVLEAIGLIFDHAHVTQVVAVTDARNAPSLRLLERVGMRRLDTVAAVFRGDRCIEHIYAISRHLSGS